MKHVEQKLQTAIVVDPEVIVAFWAQVDCSAGPDACWPWRGSRVPNGYGKFYHRLIGITGAHRFACEITTGIKLGKLSALHRCDNRPCCNPKHLWPGTQKQNMHDAMEKGRHVPPPPTNWRVSMRSKPHHWQRITAEEAIEIRRRALNGEDQTKIGADYGVNSRTVSKIKLGQRWAHV